MPDRPSNLVVLGGAQGVGVQASGAQGVGAQCARVFTRAGWTCFIADKDARALSDLQEELGAKLGHYVGDLDTSLGLRNVLAGALSAFNRIDAVVHIPDIRDGAGLLDGETSDFEERLVAPARAVTTAMRLFARQILDQRQLEEQEEGDAPPRANCFIQILSMEAVTSDPGRYAQSAAQAMTLAAAQSASLELARHGLRTNTVLAIRPRAERDETWLKARTPTGRACQADEIAHTAWYLASPGAANMTGQTITLDGGRSRLNGVMFDCVRKEER